LLHFLLALMKNYLPGKYFRLRAAALLGAAWLVLVSPPHDVAAQVPAASLTSPAYPVLINATGHLTDLFFMAGQCVHRGQILAKMERPDGSPYYILSPVTGRITASRLMLGGAYLPMHTLLATVDVRRHSAVVSR
jgi:multidrug resistance efflux pump